MGNILTGSHLMLTCWMEFFLTFRRRLPVRGSGSCTDTFPSLTVSGPFLPDAPGFREHQGGMTVSFHLNFGLHLRLFPSIFISTTALMFSVLSLLLTWPTHSSLLLLITVAICSTFASSKISSFLRCSNRRTPIAHRTILISVVAIRLSSLTDIGHVSQPYSSVGRINVWYGSSISLRLSCRKSLHSVLSISTMPLLLCSPRLCWLLLSCLSLIQDI